MFKSFVVKVLSYVDYFRVFLEKIRILYLTKSEWSKQKKRGKLIVTSNIYVFGYYIK